MHHDDSNTRLVVLGPAGTTHHLQNVRDGEIHVPPSGCVEKLRTLDDDQVSRGVDPPRQRGRGHQDLNFLLNIQTFNQLPVRLPEPSMVQADTELKRVLEG